MVKQGFVTSPMVEKLRIFFRLHKMMQNKNKYTSTGKIKKRHSGLFERYAYGITIHRFCDIICE